MNDDSTAHARGVQLLSPPRPGPRHLVQRPAAWRRWNDQLGSRLLRAVILLGTAGVLAMWWSGDAEITASPGNFAKGTAELTGLLAGWLVCVQLLLIVRVPWFERAVGQDRLTLWHAVTGTSVIVLTTMHVIGVIAAHALWKNAAVWGTAWKILTEHRDMWSAVAGTLVFFAIGITSMRFIRRRIGYEAWYAIHSLGYLAVFLAVIHQFTSEAHLSRPLYLALWITLYAATAACIVTWRFVLPVQRTLRWRMRIARTVPEGEDATSVWISGDRLHELRVRPGQYFRFRFLAPGHWLTAHPYSVSGMPRSGMMRITVGSGGDHSRAARQLAPGTIVLAEGPFGRTTPERSTRRRALLVAGGVGIAPIRTLAEALIGMGRRVTLIYRARSARQLALVDELRGMPGIELVLAVGRRSELGGDPLAPERLLATVPDLARCDVFACGPAGMIEQVRRAARAAGVPGERIHFEDVSWL